MFYTSVRQVIEGLEQARAVSRRNKEQGAGADSGNVITQSGLADAEPLLASELNGLGCHGGGDPLPFAGADEGQRLTRQHHHPGVDHLLQVLAPPTTVVESASGVTEGGRTGLTSMTTGVLFLLAVVFSPLFLTIPSFATAPALIIVGFYMMGSALKIEFDDPAEGIPAFLTILAMPTAYSISEGIAIGVISWTLLNVITGKAKEKKISPLMYVLTVLFILKYVFL